MKEIVYQKIRTQITRSKYGEVIMVSSFPKYNVEYVTKLLAIFEKEGIKRSRGQSPLTSLPLPNWFYLYEQECSYQMIFREEERKTVDEK